MVAAEIDRARVLATVLPNDAANVFTITLSARNLNLDLEIIARGEGADDRAQIAARAARASAGGDAPHYISAPSGLRG